MIESPLLKELMVENTRETMLKVLVARFGPDAQSVRPGLDANENDKRLDKLIERAAACPDLEAFKKELGRQRLKRR
jgi:hypothetical protein